MRIFHPDENAELLSAWLIHAHKERDRHDQAARCYEARRVFLGGMAIILSTIVGTSVFSSLAVDKTSKWLAVGVGLLSVTATAFTALCTFLDYAGRAQRHRKAAADCKGIVQEIEQELASSAGRQVDVSWVDSIRKRFDTIATDSPVVTRGFYGEIQHEYECVHLVHKAADLYPDRMASIP